MAYYLKYFEEHSDYESFIANDKSLAANVCYCDDGNEVYFMETNKSNLIDHFICIDEMPMHCVKYSDEYGEHEEWSEDYYDYEVSKEDYILNYFLPLARDPYNDLYPNIYKYVGEYEYDSQKYYMWKHIKNDDYQSDDNYLYILTYKKSFKGLTVRDNIKNRFNPIFAILKDDKSINYLNGDDYIKDKILFDEWEVNYSKEYLTIEALEDGEINFYISETDNTDVVESISYSLDNGDTWITTLNQDNKNDNIKITVNVDTGDKVLWKGDVYNYNDLFNEGSFGWFKFNCKCNVYGNIMSLTYEDDFKNQTVLKGTLSFLFSGCAVVDASKLILPSTILITGCYFEMFMDCTSLIAAPELPATILAEKCYGYMFDRCTSLEIPPKLPVTILAEGCYEGMFKDCTSLVTAPELLATTLKEACYVCMFMNCTSLTKAPELQATTLVPYCYEYMFYGCSSLNYIKAMFTTTPGTQYTMEWVCGVALEGTFIKNLLSTWDVLGNNGVPENWDIKESDNNTYEHYIVLDGIKTGIDNTYIDRTVINEESARYTRSKDDYMNTYLLLDRYLGFADHTYKYIAEYEYDSKKYYIWKNLGLYDYYTGQEPIFTYILTKEKSFKGLTIRDNIDNRYSPEIIFLTEDKNIYDGIQRQDERKLILWDEWYENDYSNQYLTIEALDDGTISFILNGQSTEAITSISYSKDNGLTWETIINEEEPKIINVNVHNGDKVLWKGKAKTMNEDDNFAGFCSNIPVNVYGNIMSMLYEDKFSGKYYFPSPNTLFTSFFGDNKGMKIGEKYLWGPNTSLNIINACNLVLPATDLVESCYSKMFHGCTSLITPPKLPATVLAEGCYYAMFENCTSLLKAPALYIYELVENCYSYMFNNCTSLNTIFLYNCSDSYLKFNNTYAEQFIENINIFGNIVLCGIDETTIMTPSNWITWYL